MTACPIMHRPFVRQAAPRERAKPCVGSAFDVSDGHVAFVGHCNPRGTCLAQAERPVPIAAEAGFVAH